MIRTELVNNGAEAVAHLNALPNRIREELRVGIGRANVKLVRAVKQKLSGEVLKVRSDRLRRSIGDIVEETQTTVSGVVSTPVKYAPPNEYGFHGTVSVRAHMREIKQAFGRPIAPMQVQVGAFSRAMNLPERSFMRSALRDLEAAGVIDAEINAALGRAVQ